LIKKDKKIKSQHIVYEPPPINKDYINVRINVILKMLTENIKNISKMKILDVASGRGELLKSLTSHGMNAEGIDFDKKCVELSNKHSKCTYGNALEVDNYFSNNQFDLVVCSHFLEHTENPKIMVERLKKISKQYILLIVPNLAQFITLEHSKPSYVTKGHLCGWDHGHFKTFLEIHCNLKVVNWACDQVIIPGRPLWQKIPLLRNFLRFFETRILPLIFPYVSNSIIALCKKN
jgi:ubiquinone/menaquinone biosynthesis C-methylase UbiE